MTLNWPLIVTTGLALAISIAVVFAVRWDRRRMQAQADRDKPKTDAGRGIYATRDLTAPFREFEGR